jgi:hypothetical protein
MRLIKNERSPLILSIGLLVFLLSGCRAGALPVQPSITAPATSDLAQPAAPTATLLPGPVATATEPPATPGQPVACPAEGPGTRLYTNAEQGFCLLIPADFTFQPAYDPGEKELYFTGPSYSPPKSMDTAVATLAIGYTGPADGLDSAGYAARWQELFNPGERLTPQDLLLAGHPAVVLDGIPGFFPRRGAFLVVNERKYRLTILPRPEDVAELAGATQFAWDLALRSLVIFEPIHPLAYVRPEQVCTAETAEARLYISMVDGYCFQYPADFEPHPDFSGRIEGGPVLANVEGFGDVRTSLTFGRFGYFAGQSLGQIIEPRLEFIDKSTLRETTIASQPALTFVDAREPWASRQAMILKDDIVYTILAQPWEPGRFPSGIPYLERAWEMVIRTTAFFSPWR